MNKGLFSKSCASAVMLSISIGMLGSTGFAQTATPSPEPAKQAKEDKKSKKKQESAKKTETKTPAVQDNNPNRPLDVNENPAMIGKRNINKGLWAGMSGSIEKEVAAGRQIALQVDQEAKFVDDPIVTEYINRVGQNIVLHSDAKVPFTIKVVDSDEVNAFALPGGFFYVNRGLILAADNEAEVAGVMAHEIAHVAARHAMENAAKGTFMNYAMLAGMTFGGPIASTVLQNAGGIFGGMAMMKFSRGAENEADRLGVQYMYAAGYDPTAMATMFEKLAAQNKKKPGSFAKLFSSHPQSLDRRTAVLGLIGRFQERDEYVISSSEFQRVKARLLRMSNARSTATADLDEGDGRPTLKRRSPAEGGDPDSTSTSNDDAPPVLKRKTEQPAETTEEKKP